MGYPLNMAIGSKLLTLLCCIGLFACGGESSDPLALKSAGSAAANKGCDGQCANLNLSVDDVGLILRQAVATAQQLGVSATVAVVDRVGNVLAVYQMPGAIPTSQINGRMGALGGIEGTTVRATLAAISKAGTGAYLSSQGNAFSTRTAGQIVQENFNPGEQNQPAGPLFGVQFSQLLCSDVTVLAAEFSAGAGSSSKPKSAGLIGPRPLPLGLSADPGGIPLYKQGDLVGGIGVELDGLYSFDRIITDEDDDPEERIALAGGRGFEIPSEIAGDQIFVAGKSLRTVDLDYSNLADPDAALPELDPAALQTVPLFSTGAIRAGAVFGDPSSGIARTTRAGVSAAILVDASGGARFPTRPGTALSGGEQLKTQEVDALLDSVLLTAFRTRAAIRTPRDTQAHVSIWVVDHLGNPLGMVRTSDAPVFGLDVALQKARGAVFFSSADAGSSLENLGLSHFVNAARAFLGPEALTGSHAFTDRAVGNLSRPFYPDGINGNANGPFSRPFPGTAPGVTWSPFSTGLQLELIVAQIAEPIVSGRVSGSCVSGSAGSRLRNGIQIFPGSVPLYRGRVLIGGVGISGDGIDQDDLIGFYGSSRLGLDFAGHSSVGDPGLGFNAPFEIRADTIEGLVTRLRYVNCPDSPFRDSSDQRVCEGL